MNRAAILTAIVLVLAGCGGDDAATTTTQPGDDQPATIATTSTVAAQPTETTTTTSSPATTTTTGVPQETTTTVAPPPPAAGALALTRVVFEPSSYVVITNVGGEPAELGGHWLCVFPLYQQLPDQTLEAGESVAVGLGSETPPDLLDFVAVFDLGPVVGTADAADGEMALYTAADFGSASAMIDYVEWGESGHQRSSVAAEAGIWSPGAFIEVPEEALSISSSGATGANEADWFVDIGG